MSARTPDGAPETGGLDLREQIDELAARLVLDGAGDDVAAAQPALSREAGGRGCPRTARIASEWTQAEVGSLFVGVALTLRRPGAAFPQEFKEERNAIDSRCAG